MLKNICRFFVAACFFYSCKPANRQPTQLSNNDIMKVIGAFTNLMVHDITNPPLGARFFSYECLAGYEIAAQHNKGLPRMHGAVNAYPDIKIPDSISNYSWQLASILAMLETSQKMQPSGKQLAPFQQAFIDSCKSLGWDEALIQQSLKCAQYVSKAVLAYAKSDYYNKISNLERYTPKTGDGYWYPTPPAYMAAVEPHFNTVRPFFLDSVNQFVAPRPVPYSTDKNSDFYKMLYSNYQQGETFITDEHRMIAAYWDCNPFAVQDMGHLLVGLKKISPGAHWLGITGIACRDQKKSFEESLLIHALVSMGLMDSFMASWDEKYRSNRVRPETAIRKQIDPHWKPLLQTPPFPEYLSGHSCISATASTILSAYIGPNVAFTDTVEVRFGLPRRPFRSFEEAAKEAAISRFYGGIHFMDAIDNGLVQGKQVGELLIKKVKAR